MWLTFRQGRKGKVKSEGYNRSIAVDPATILHFLLMFNLKFEIAMFSVGCASVASSDKSPILPLEFMLPMQSALRVSKGRQAFPYKCYRWIHRLKIHHQSDPECNDKPQIFFRAYGCEGLSRNNTSGIWLAYSLFHLYPTRISFMAKRNRGGYTRKYVKLVLRYRKFFPLFRFMRYLRNLRSLCAVCTQFIRRRSRYVRDYYA